jgi:hypothetical protein
MCFFDQKIFICGDFKWAHFRQHCRIGEACGLKLIMSTTRIYEKCEGCSRLEKKISRFRKEEQRIMRWKSSFKEPEDSQRNIAVSRAASIDTSKRILEDLRHDILKMQRKRQYPFASFDCENWPVSEDGDGDEVDGRLRRDILPGLKLFALAQSNGLGALEAEPLTPGSNMFMLRFLESETPGSVPRQVHDEEDTDDLKIAIREQERLSFMLTMRLFHVAFESSISLDGTIRLPSDTIISKNQCRFFTPVMLNCIHRIKFDLLNAASSSQLFEADMEMESWLPRVVLALQNPDISVEDQPRQLQRLLATLRKIQSQIRLSGFHKVALASLSCEPEQLSPTKLPHPTTVS